MLPPLAFVQLKLRNWSARYKQMSWARILFDYQRARRLRRRDAPARPAHARPERVIVSLTTVPDRIPHLLPALRSLRDQSWPADRVLLAWPRHSIRNGVAYPAPPELPAWVEILSCEDQGPATKLLPALLAEPDALIVVVDDDVIYPYDFIETLLSAWRQSPNAVVGWRGWKFEGNVDPRHLDHVFATAVTKPQDVHVLMGTWGYLVPARLLNADVHEFDSWPPEVRWCDDVWICGHLARAGISRKVIAGKGLPIESRASGIAALTFGINRSGHNDRIAIAAFRQWW